MVVVMSKFIIMIYLGG